MTVLDSVAGERPGVDGEHEPIDAEIAQFVAAITEGAARHAHLAAGSMIQQRNAAEVVRTDWRQGGPKMRRVRDLTARAGEHAVRVRLFEPDTAEQRRPALIYVHGGGFTLFSLDTHDRLMREYAARAGVVVVGVDYSLSPEVRFPTALHEVVAAIDWLVAEAANLDIDPHRIAIGGDSAGANLSLAACLVLRDRGAGDRIAAMLFNYGFFGADFDTPSARRHGGAGKLLTIDELEGYLRHYLGDQPRTDPLALPALAKLHDLPPSLHVIPTCDPLADADRVMAQLLVAAGSEATTREYRGATHSFLEAVSSSALADRAFAESSDWLRGMLAQPAAAAG